MESVESVRRGPDNPSDGCASLALSTKSGPAMAPNFALNSGCNWYCGKCGELGHTKANKKCPLYDPADSAVPGACKCSKCGAVGHTKASKKCPHYDPTAYRTPAHYARDTAIHNGRAQAAAMSGHGEGNAQTPMAD